MHSKKDNNIRTKFEKGIKHYTDEKKWTQTWKWKHTNTSKLKKNSQFPSFLFYFSITAFLFQSSIFFVFISDLHKRNSETIFFHSQSSSLSLTSVTRCNFYCQKSQTLRLQRATASEQINVSWLLQICWIKQELQLPLPKNRYITIGLR